MNKRFDDAKRVEGLDLEGIVLNRRQFLAQILSTSASLALAAGGLIVPARALANERYKGRKVVFASWGGAYQHVQKVSFCEPFERRTGASVIQAGPVNFGKLRVMIKSGQPTWDVVDVTMEFLYNTQGDNFYEPIDKNIVDVTRIEPKFVTDYGVGDIVWSYNLGYNTDAFPGNKHPRNWSEFFDTKRFPGRRSVNGDVEGMLEIALLADGVHPKDLYPLDVDRAFKKLDTIKGDAVFWSTNSQSQQLLVNGECSCGVINNGRIYDAVKKGGHLGIVWEQNLQEVDYLVVPKGARDVSVAMGLVNEMTRAHSQAKTANLMALAPTNTAAFKYIDAKVKPWLPTNPTNAKKGFVISAPYWRKNQHKLSERWEQWKIS